MYRSCRHVSMAMLYEKGIAILLPVSKNNLGIPRPPEMGLYRDYFLELFEECQKLEPEIKAALELPTHLVEPDSSDAPLRRTGKRKVHKLILSVSEPLRVKYIYRWLCLAEVFAHHRNRYVSVALDLICSVLTPLSLVGSAPCRN